MCRGGRSLDPRSTSQQTQSGSELGEGLGRGTRPSPGPQRPRSWGVRGGDQAMSPLQSQPSHLTPDHLPLSPGLVASDKESAAHILSRKTGGNLLGIITGGAQEALNARPGSYKLVLRNRKGFVRLALRHG